MDEPTSNLDRKTAIHLIDVLLKSLPLAAMLIISHQKEEFMKDFSVIDL